MGPSPNTPDTPGAPAARASDAEREAAVRRLQDAFAERRLDDDEFDHRARAALTARTLAELDELLTDLPAPATGGPAAGAPAPTGPNPGRMTIAYKNSVRRSGRWTVPPGYAALIYKGSGLLDLRAATLPGPVTTITAIAYKSGLEIVVPPGARVETSGFGASTGEPGADLEITPAPGAPVIHIRGYAYKGTITVSTRPVAR